MSEHRKILSASVVFILIVVTLCPGCLTIIPQEENLTATGLADQYLVHADGIRDYRSEYSVSSGTAENPFSERIRYDYKAPSFARMEQTRSSSRVPGSFATTNGTWTAWYDAETRTYDLSSAMKLPREYRLPADSPADRRGPGLYDYRAGYQPWAGTVPDRGGDRTLVRQVHAIHQLPNPCVG